MLPKDPFILFSTLNTKMRDEGLTFSEICAELDEDPAELEERLAKAGFRYDAERRRFV